MSEVLRLSDRIYPDYIAAGEYYSYLETKIDNEQRLARMLHSSGIITESGLNKIQAFSEAKISDKVKSKWQKFVEFIKGLVDKFMESMTNILLDEKDYLEKYKDIILKKKPRDDFEYSYTGDYELGIDRMINMEVPIFNYEAHAAALKEDGDAPILDKIMSGKDGFTYDENETLADQFKGWYLALEKGQRTGKFENLNWTNMYNFCYNFKNIKDMVDKDVKHLESSTNSIQQAIVKELRANGEADVAKAEESPATSTTTSGGSDNSTATSGGPESSSTSSSSTSESFRFATGTYFREAEDKVKTGTNLNITNSNATKQMGSYSSDDKGDVSNETKEKNAAAAKDNSETEEEIDKITTKWTRICNPIITAKMYACQHIAKDYMEIIRTHVRSYGGKDLKKDKNDKAAQTATNYKKNGEANKETGKAEGSESKTESAIEYTQKKTILW